MMKLAFVIVVVALCYSQTVHAGLECDGCMFVMGKLQGYLENNTKLENTTVTLIDNDICSHLPTKYQAQCDDLAASYIPSAMEALEAKYMDPTSVCDELHMCKSDGNSPLMFDERVGSIKGAIECKLCTLATDFIAKKLDQNSTEMMVETDLTKICDILPKSIKGMCENAVAAETPALMQDLAAKVESDACVDLHMCTESQEVPSSETNGIECSLCELALDKLQSYVENSTTLDSKIETFLEDDFCTKLPKSVQAICNSTVATETPDIMYALADKFLNGDVDCVAFGICKKESTPLLGSSEDDLKCAVCQKAAQFLDAKVFESPKVDAFLVGELDNFCAMLPAEFGALCKAAAEGAAPKALQLLGKFIASQGCDDVGFCKK